MRNLFIIFFCISCISCSKKEADTAFSEASYKITITGKWKSPEFTVPGSVHFTEFAGMVHNANSEIWQAGKIANKGLEDVAEVGNSVIMMAMTDSMIVAKSAFSFVIINPPAPTGTVTSTINCNSNFSIISLASMIAPSPDWFTGVSNLNLYPGNKWITDTLLNVYVYDAGTEDGDVFGYNNPPTFPQQLIQILTPAKAMVLANGNAALGPIATIRFTKL